MVGVEIEFGDGDVSLQYARVKWDEFPSRRLIILIVFRREGDIAP
jgi:hypothetical protein